MFRWLRRQRNGKKERVEDAAPVSKPKPKQLRRLPVKRIGRVVEECMKQGSHESINGTDVRMFGESAFSFWCDRYADVANKDPPDSIMARLEERNRELGLAHEREVLDAEQPKAVEMDPVDPEVRIEHFRGTDIRLDGMGHNESFYAGLMGMACGAMTVSQATLFYLPLGLVGKPDLLERRSGRSRLGPYHYVVTEIKSARTVTYGHIMQAAFYNMLLGRIQGRVPKYFYIMDGRKERRECAFAAYEQRLADAIERIRGMSPDDMPEPVYGRGRQPWMSYANRMAIQSNSPSLVRMIGTKRIGMLNDAGILTVADIVASGPDRISHAIHMKIGRQVMESATAISENRAVRRAAWRHDFPQSDTEIFLDLEWRPGSTVEDNAVYFVGLLTRTKGRQDEYQPFLPQQGPTSASELMDVLSKPNCPIYHWSSPDRSYLLGLLADCQIKVPHAFETRFVDLYPIADRLFAFPIPDMNVNHISEWLGHRPANPDVNAFNAYELYNSYQKTADEEDLKLVIEYNKDDCMAVARIKEWLVENQNGPD